MQYILTEEEYKSLVPIEKMHKLQEKVERLNSKVMEQTGYPCPKGVNSRSATFYCDDCPIGSFGTRTCTKSQQYSK